MKIKLNDKFGFVNKEGKEMIAPKYEYAESFFEGIAVVRLYVYEGFINSTGIEYWEINPSEFKGRPKR